MTDRGAFFTSRLRALLTQPRPDGRPWNDSALAKAAADRGHHLSPSYARQLRTGQRTNPTLDVIAALCDVFEVPPTYFHDTDQADDIVNALKTLQTAGSQAILTHGERHLPPDTLRLIAEAIESHGWK